MTVSIKYNTDLVIVQIQADVPETAGPQQFTFKGPHRLLHAWGVMTGAGASGDTAQLKKNTTAISDAVDVSAKLDQAYFNFGTLDDAQMDFDDTDLIWLDTASDANCMVTMLFAQVQLPTP